MAPDPDQIGTSSKRTVISVDAMGGDRGPKTVVAGLSRFARTSDSVDFILHGPKAELEPLVARRRNLAGRCEVRDAPEIVSAERKPAEILRTGRNTSMWSAIESVRDGEATVCVSGGSTGALMLLSVVRLRKLPGVLRPAIAVLWPSANAQTGYNIMLDAGGDILADARDLTHYALMGTAYSRYGFGLERPRVGLLNVGTEEHKGRPELKEAHSAIGACAGRAGFDFVGFVEGADLLGTVCDVIVTDGFTGNVAIKTGEGTAGLISSFLREAFSHSPLSRLASLMAYTSLRRLRRRIDPRAVNGGVFLGLNGTVVKSHGASDAIGVTAAFKLAADLAQYDFSSVIAEQVAYAGDVGGGAPAPAEEENG